jgi:hypothetical protein
LAIVREREAESAVGPIAIVAGTGHAARQARAFAESGHLFRPIRVFSEQHEASRWLDQQGDKPIDSKSLGRPPVPPLKLD